MNRVPTKGYDPLCEYTVEELVTMYQRQGLNEAEAAERAKTAHREIKTLNQRERRMWAKTRKHEEPRGLLVERP